MGIKLKNRYICTLVFILSIYMLTVSIFSVFDIIKYRSYIASNSYFDSFTYKNDLREYFENVSIIIAESKANSSKGTTRSNGLKSLESTIDAKKIIRYYIKDKSNGEVYTNIEGAADVDAFINNEALYVDNFPKKSVTDYYIKSINSWFVNSNYEGKFIFLKNAEGSSQMEDNYRYYNSVRERILKEGILCAATLIIGLSAMIFLQVKACMEILFIHKLEQISERIPLDMRILIFIAYSLIMMTYFNETAIFYKPIEIRHLLKLTFAAVYVFYLILSFRYALKLLNNTELLTGQWKNSLSSQIYTLTQDNFKYRSLIFKAGTIFALTTLLGIFAFIGIYGMTRNRSSYLVMASIYAAVYAFSVPLYSIKRIILLSKILKGTDEIVAGNFDYRIEETGKSNLSRLASNINNMKEGFRKSVDAQLRSERLKTELISNVSHDLKTPLTSIINYVSLLKKGNASEEQEKAYIDVLDQKSQRLKLLIEDLFEASKMSSGAVELNIEKVDIAALLRQALGEFDERISNSTLTFRLNIPAEEVILQLDGKKTWRVFENLISNALKYSQRDSRVYIDLIEQPDKVSVIMKNMSAYEMDFDVEEIFERFKRGDKARTSEGSGLGLSIAKSIVELQNGRMRIDIDGDLFKVIVEFTK